MRVILFQKFDGISSGGTLLRVLIPARFKMIPKLLHIPTEIAWSCSRWFPLKNLLIDFEAGELLLVFDIRVGKFRIKAL
jgi:hypothetical protein